MARVDTRDVVERLADIVEAADFERTHPNEPIERCECGATLLRPAFDAGVTCCEFVCAGCGMVPTYRIHPAPVLAQSFSGDWERGAPPELSEGLTSTSRKDADAPGVDVAPGSGLLGRAGKALRSLRLNWGLIYGMTLVVGFWSLLGYAVGRGL